MTKFHQEEPTNPIEGKRQVGPFGWWGFDDGMPFGYDLLLNAGVFCVCTYVCLCVCVCASIYYSHPSNPEGLVG